MSGATESAQILSSHLTPTLNPYTLLSIRLDASYCPSYLMTQRHKQPLFSKTSRIDFLTAAC